MKNPYGFGHVLQAHAPTPDHRQALLALNRSVAKILGLNARRTISSNAAAALARDLGLDVRTAKFLFHGGVAALLGVFLRSKGIGTPGATLAAVGALAWLESFDGSGRQR